MKTKMFLVCLFVAGIAASFAIASPPPGKGNPNGATSTGALTGTTTTAHANGHAGKVALCHATHSKSNPYVKIWVSKNRVKAHERLGDLAVSADGSCPKGSKPGASRTNATTGTTGP